MKKVSIAVLGCVFLLLCAGCHGKKPDEVTLRAEDVQNIIVNYYETNDAGNYVSSRVDSENNLVIVTLKDIGKEKQDAFLYNVFAHRTGSLYIKTIKEQSVLVFVAEQPEPSDR